MVKSLKIRAKALQKDIIQYLNEPSDIVKNAAYNVRHELKTNPRTTNLYDRIAKTNELIQAGKTPFDVIYDNGLSTIRHYKTPAEFSDVTINDQPKQNIPIVIVPPLAVNMYIYDLFPERSFVQYLLSQGFDVYLIDWGTPKRINADRNFASYVIDDMPQFLSKIKDHAHKSQLTLHGWSMGGLFSLLYSAYFNDQTVKNLVLLGVPIDSHQSGYIGKTAALLGKALKVAEQKTGLHPRYLPTSLWHTYGWMNIVGFKLIDPVATLNSFIKFIRTSHLRESVQEHATMGAFLNHMVDYPGGVMYDIMNYIWLENALKKGVFPLRDKLVSLKDIKQNILAVSGNTDAIVTLDSIQPITTITGSPDSTLITTDGGHLGIVSNRKAQQEVWPFISEWLKTHDELPAITYVNDK